MDGKDGLRIAYNKKLSKKYLGRWVDGWKEGRKDGGESRVKDCLQQSINR